MNIFLNDRIFEIVASVAEKEKTEAYVIGGFVRDNIMGRENPDKDVDIVVLGDGVTIARKVAKSISPGIKVTVYKTYGTAMFRFENYDIEFVGARKESYQRHSRNPEVTPGTLEDDQNRRDFTVNALAISLNRNNYGEVIDPFGGLNDIKHKILRTPLEPDTTFSDDR